MRLVGDAVLGVVEIDSGRLERQALAALGVVREQLAQMHRRDLLVVGLQGRPGRALQAAAGV